MKYKDLINFEPISEVVRFDRLSDDDYRRSLVRDFVFSQTYEDVTIPAICKNLDYSSGRDTFGLQIVGNYGTGKSHLMSLFSLIAEDASYLPLVSSEKAREAFQPIAGKYKVIRFELGNDQELWDIVRYQIDKSLAEFGVDYSIQADNTMDPYSVKLSKMMGYFEAKYPDKGLMIIIDEMLAYLKGRSASAKLNRDLAVLQALGQSSDHSKFRMVFGVQELIYNAPEFQFAANMLQKVNDRSRQIVITKQDVQYVVQHRLLRKNDTQRDLIRRHLSKFTSFFTDLHAQFDDYVELFPVHPSYFDNFQQIKIGKAQREVLKTLTHKFESLLDEDVPDCEPGLICYDSYWDDLRVSDMQTDPDIRKVTEIMDTVCQKIEDNFTGARARRAVLAKRIASACAIKILQASLDKQNGVTAESLVDDLCYLDATCFDRSLLYEVISSTAAMMVTATQGQYFEKNSNNQEYHLRVEGGVNYEQKIKDFAAQMTDSVKDEHFYTFLVEYLPIEVEQYRREFKIFQHKIDWNSHKMMLDGYIFMGNPAERDTTHPQQHFYIYFMPIFCKEAMQHGDEPDSVYIHMDKVSDEMKELLSLYASAEALMASVDSSQKKFYEQFRKAYAEKLKPVFARDFVACTEVVYRGEVQAISPTLMNGGSKEQIISKIASTLLEEYFCESLPDYPKFQMLSYPLTSENMNTMMRSAKQKIVEPTKPNRDGEAILAGLGLLKDNQLSTEQSIYAQSLRQQMQIKGEGQVLNREEIIYNFFGTIYRSVDFHIDADFEFLVLAAMVAMGEIEIDYSGSNVNAANIRNILDFSHDQYTSFSHIRRPKGLNVAAVKELFLGFLGKDLTSQIDNPEVYSQLVAMEKEVAGRAVSLSARIANGFSYGDIEVISPNEGYQMKQKLTTLASTCDKLQTFVTKAKMRNMQWTAEELRPILATIKEMTDKENILKLVSDLGGRVSYLKQARQYIVNDTLMADIDTSLDKMADILANKDNDSKVAAYKAELDALAGRYADWYLQEYQRFHINELEMDKKNRLMRSDKKEICQQVYNADIITVASAYGDWEGRMSQLTLGSPSVTKNAVLTSPYQGFNPQAFKGKMLPSIAELSDELDKIFTEVNEAMHTLLNDNSLKQNIEVVLNDGERRILERFKDESLTKNNVGLLLEIIGKLHQNITTVKISEKDLKTVFNRPMTPNDMIKAFNAYIKSITSGNDNDSTRIIFK